jgi:hypothetical protein
MHLKQCLCFAALTLGVLVSGSTSLHAQGMFGGNVNGTPGIALPPTDLYRSLSTGRAYTDLELTAITRAEEDTANQAVLDSIGKLLKAANDARTSLVAASLTVPADAATMTARAKALADADQALAAARATTLAGLVRKILPGSDETKIRAVAASMETRATARAARPAQ